MNDIKKIKIDIHKIISKKFESLSPYLIPEFFVTSKDPISGEESLTFQYFNEEESVEQKFDDEMIVMYGKSTKKILAIKNFTTINSKGIASLKKSDLFSNLDLILKILEDYFKEKKKS